MDHQTRQITAAVSLEAMDGAWVRAEVTVSALPGESPLACWERAYDMASTFARVKADALAEDVRARRLTALQGG